MFEDNHFLLRVGLWGGWNIGLYYYWPCDLYDDELFEALNLVGHWKERQAERAHYVLGKGPLL